MTPCSTNLCSTKSSGPSLHILGICGTFMTGLARLALEKGFFVSGMDRSCSYPMDKQVSQMGISLHSDSEIPKTDNVVIGNIFSRGDPLIERILNDKTPYLSGPQWLYKNILKDKKVIAISGTHGKTTTSAMVAWILDQNGHQPGFLIGGVAENFSVSARLGQPGGWFVVEADEYDSAFFDKRPKFLHYRPDVLLINNLEMDHADIYPDLAAIQTQFHYLLRQLPSLATVIYPAADLAVQAVIERGCWSKTSRLGVDWEMTTCDHKETRVRYRDQWAISPPLPLIGEHNQQNALAAIAIAQEAAGIHPEESLKSLQTFKNVKRRLEEKKCWKTPTGEIKLLDDFAHHPTAIQLTLNGLKNHNKTKPCKLTALLDINSNSMKMGIHQNQLANAFSAADRVIVWQNDRVLWSVKKTLMPTIGDKLTIFSSIEKMAEYVSQTLSENETLVMLSNGSFGHLNDLLIEKINRIV